ncbi:MAG TPA: hypothetical protein ENH70_07720 [Desulfobacteraceae bacterium]|nr:hypothetical protein [Desulfobacteraceae bacterium]
MLKGEISLDTWIKRSVITIVLMLLAGGYVIPFRNGNGYIMPAEQLLGLMSARFSRFHTVLLTQSTQLMTTGEEDRETISFEEKVWIQSPGLHGSLVVPEIEGRDMTPEDIQSLRLDVDSGYRKLLVANTAGNLSTYLMEWGIDRETVSLTRINGVIAFCIGKSPKEGPRLLIEKERFLPLLLSHRATLGQETREVEVRFEDYRKTQNGWFPFRIEYFLDGEPVEKYIVLEANFNVFLPSGLIKNNPQ